MSKAPQNDEVIKETPSRRKFLGQVGGAAAAALAVGAVSFDSIAGAEGKAVSPLSGNLHGQARANASFTNRKNAAAAELAVPIPLHPTNGDEQRYANKAGSYSKALPHDAIGQVDLAAWGTLINALTTGQPADFEAITLGGNVKLTCPQSGLAYDLEGTDSHQLQLTAAYPVGGQDRADEMIENYWMALCRDVNFRDYGTDPTAQAAVAELSGLAKFHGPKDGSGQVTSDLLFRGSLVGETSGPYISQFLIQPFNYGALTVNNAINTYQANLDYMTNATDYLAVQNGQGPFAANTTDPTARFIRNGRDLSAWVHVDVLFETYFNAVLFLLDGGAPLNPGNPYNSSLTQTAFGTFGGPHIASQVCSVAHKALKTVWYQKWFVHRALRPEAYGGLVHFRKTGLDQGAYSFLHHDVLNSNAVAQVGEKFNGNYFLPMAFPEGSPTHPSYGQGHGTVAGVCVTVAKAFFDDRVPFSSLVNGTAKFFQASQDGTTLNEYTDSDTTGITIGDELNKLAGNIALGRDHAGVHWRSDYFYSLLLGEQLAISILSDQKGNYNESFSGFTFTKFDGTRVTI